MIQTQEIETTITEQTSYDLIKGEFEADDALDIINHMLQKKINFHETRIFSQEIRFGEKDEKSMKRIKELKQVNKELNERIKEAKAIGKSIRISSSISIELV
jgi:predicted transglutaminase-like cysteine proteinase